MSPEIHAQFADGEGIQLSYTKQRLDEAEFQHYFESFWQAGGIGANVTVPLKLAAFNYASTLDSYAQQAGAVNTLFYQQGQVHGYNTDGLGLCADLTLRHGIELNDATVLILGAGGAVRGVLAPLIEAGCRHIVIANRTVSTAVDLAKLFVTPTSTVLGLGYAQLSSYVSQQLSRPIDLIINATSFALSQAAPGASEGATDVTLPIDPSLVADVTCYDMSYGKSAVFCRWAEQHQAAKSIDGFGMLVEQAAFAFKIWHGVFPDTQSVYERLRPNSN